MFDFFPRVLYNEFVFRLCDRSVRDGVDLRTAKRFRAAGAAKDKNFTEIEIMSKAKFIIATDSTGEMPLEYYKDTISSGYASGL